MVLVECMYVVVVVIVVGIPAAGCGTTTGQSIHRIFRGNRRVLTTYLLP